jgi:holliday junction DNA helicase RuvB
MSIRTPGVDRVQTPHERADDELDVTLRPKRLDEFVGQDELKEQLGV